MTEDTFLPFDVPAVQSKKMTADVAGASVSSDGGLVLLRAAERRPALADTPAGCIREWRDPQPTVHTLPAILRLLERIRFRRKRIRRFGCSCGTLGVGWNR